MKETPAADFAVQRKNLRESRITPARLEPRPGEVLLRIDKFALTANNITYAVFGDAVLEFFPAADGWGRVPVWGRTSSAHAAGNSG